MSPHPTAARANDWTLHIGTDTLAFSSATRGSDYFRWTDTTNFGTSSTPFTDGAVLAAKITTTNVAPTVANVIPDQEAMGGMAFNYVVPANTFSDGDSDTLTYMATKADGAALPTWLSFDAGTSTFSGMPQDADVGTVSVKVTASDGNGGSVSDEFDITVVRHHPAHADQRHGCLKRTACPSGLQRGVRTPRKLGCSGPSLPTLSPGTSPCHRGRRRSRRSRRAFGRRITAPEDDSLASPPPSARARPSWSPTPTPRPATTPSPLRTPPATRPPPSPPAGTASPPSPTTPPSTPPRPR